MSSFIQVLRYVSSKQTTGQKPLSKVFICDGILEQRGALADVDKSIEFLPVWLSGIYIQDSPWNLQCQGSMMLLANDLMLDSSLLLDIDNSLVKRRDSVRTNDIVLAFGKTSRTRRGRRETTRVLKLQELDQLFLGRLLEIDLSEVNHFLVMLGEDDLSGDVGLFNREDSKRVRSHEEEEEGGGRREGRRTIERNRQKTDTAEETTCTYTQ